MKILVKKEYLQDTPEQIMRQASYGFIHSRHTGHDSFVRRASRDHYPRFHVYIKDRGSVIEFNLHLDQKKVSYDGSHAHNAEYEGKIVASEIERIKDVIRKQALNIA